MRLRADGMIRVARPGRLRGRPERTCRTSDNRSPIRPMIPQLLSGSFPLDWSVRGCRVARWSIPTASVVRCSLPLRTGASRGREVPVSVLTGACVLSLRAFISCLPEVSPALEVGYCIDHARALLRRSGLQPDELALKDVGMTAVVQALQ